MLMQSKKESPFLTLPEASEYLKLAKQTIYQYCHNKIIPYYKPNNRNIYFRKTDLDNFILNKDNFFKSNSQIKSEAALTQS